MSFRIACELGSCVSRLPRELPGELGSLIGRTIPFRLTYRNGPWNQRKNTNLISLPVNGGRPTSCSRRIYRCRRAPTFYVG